MNDIANLSFAARLCKYGLILGFFALSGVAVSALAAENGVMQPPGARAATVQALQAMQKGQWGRARSLVAGARDPLASRIYYWMVFRDSEGPDAQNYTRLVQFIRGNPDWPGINDRRLQAEKYMPISLSPAEVAAWYNDYPPQTPTGLDRYMTALISTGRSDQAKSYLSDWWATTLMSRDDQRILYRKYGGYLDMNAHKRRFDKLLLSGQYTNARAVAQVLGKGYPELAEARIALAEESPGVNSLIGKVPQNLQSDPGLMYERLRWRRKNDMDMEAIQIIHRAPPVEQIQNPEDWWKEQHILLRRLLENHMYESAYLLAGKHFQSEGLPFAQAEWLAGWLALRFMNNPTKAYQHFETLFQGVKTPVSKARAAYWAGRAAKQFDQKELAARWFGEAAKFQTVFYGQLAGAELGLAHALPNAAPPVLTSADNAALNADDLIQAARLFHAVGMRKEASQFIQAFVKRNKTPKAYRFAAELAAEMKHYYDAVRIAKDATDEGMFLTAQSYPVITDKLKNVPIEWALVHALIRQESMFDDQAESPVGALGLMQIMPATAKEMAQKIGAQYSPASLTSPDYNIRLGAAYLEGLLARFGGSYPLAIAAYNAGPSRVNQWLETFGDPRTGQVDLIDWIELIPIYETRNYVQRVMEGVYVYRLRLKGVQRPTHAPIHIAMQDR